MKQSFLDQLEVLVLMERKSCRPDDRKRRQALNALHSVRKWITDP